MRHFSRGLRTLVIVLTTTLLAACHPAASKRDRVAVAWPAEAGTVVTLPMQRVSGRWLIPVAFRRPDGSERRAFAWLNMGVGAPILSQDLYRELGLAEGQDLTMRIGTVTVQVEREGVTDGPGRIGDQDLFALLFAPRTVEAVFPAGILQHFAVSIDPKAASLTLAQPGSFPPRGVPVPIRVNPDSGLVVLDARIDTGPVPLVVDVGAPYTWLRGRAVSRWLAQHPEWHRGDSAVGRANLAMADLDLERAGKIIRFPRVYLPGLVFQDVGALGTGPIGGALGGAALGEIFWDTWESDAGEPVVGWLGNNVLDNFRLTLDYAGRQSFWERQRAADPGDLDSVGLTLVRRGTGYVVAAVASREDRPLVPGVEVGDRLVQVDGHLLDGLPPEAVLARLSARPGQPRILDLDRGGRSVTIKAEGANF